MNEKNTANMFENAYASIGNNMPKASNLTNIVSEIGEIPLSVKELLNEVMKAKHNSDMDKLAQEIKESKIQNDLVEELQKEVRDLHAKIGNVEQEKDMESKIQNDLVEELQKEVRDLHAKIGNVEQEKTLLNSLTSKIGDIDANVMIYQKTVDQITQEIKDYKAQPDLVKEYFIKKGIKIMQENL